MTVSIGILYQKTNKSNRKLSAINIVFYKYIANFIG